MKIKPTDIDITGASSGYLLTYNGTIPTWAAPVTSGTVTSVASGNGMSFTTITGTGTVTMGTPSSTTLSSTNSLTATSHAHAFAPGGTTAQYIRGDGSLATTPVGTVTSVSGSGGTTGLTLSGGPITGAGTLTLGGTLTVANGGSGATTLTGYLKGNGASAFTAASTVPGSDITGALSGVTIDNSVIGGVTPAAITGTNVVATGYLQAGDQGTEGSGINIAGTTYQSTFKVSDINGTNSAQTILHRHSTTLQPLIVGARTNSNTSAHANVTNGMGLFSVLGVGYAGTNYKIFGLSTISADDTGTISDTSAPGKIEFWVTPNSSITPSLTATIRSTGLTIATPSGQCVTLGSTTSAATTTPVSIGMGGTFSSVAGSNPKLRLFYDGVNLYGLGVSNNQIDYMAPSGASHVWYTNSLQIAKFNSSGVLLIGTNTVSSASVASKLQVNSEIISTGTLAGLFWENRSGGVTSSSNWYGWYTSGGTIYLYNGSANIASIDPTSGVYTAIPGGPIPLRQYTVATLPTVGTAGRLAAVTDALAPTYGATVVGGGAINTPVYDNGTNWTCR